MEKNTTRTTAVLGATMALVLAGTAAVAAHPGDRGDRGWDRGGDAWMGGQMMPGARGPGGLRGMPDDFERRELTIQTADGVTSSRVEQGAVESTAEDALTFSLGSGETVTVVIDDDTQVIGYEEQERVVRGWSRTFMTPTDIESADIVAGAEVMVWSGSEDGADFVASRIVVQPAAETEDAETDAADAEAPVEETVIEADATADA